MQTTRIFEAFNDRKGEDAKHNNACTQLDPIYFEISAILNDTFVNNNLLLQIPHFVTILNFFILFDLLYFVLMHFRTHQRHLQKILINLVP